jgi:hypothetical protein
MRLGKDIYRCRLIFNFDLEILKSLNFKVFKVFSKFLFVMEGSGSMQIITVSDPGGRNHANPTDPEH